MLDIIVIGTTDIFEMVETTFDHLTHRIIGYLAPEPSTHKKYSKYTYLGNDSVIDTNEYSKAAFVIALYNNQRRSVIVQDLVRCNRPLLSVVHPSSVVMPSAILGEGTTVAFLCTLSSAVRTGKAVVIRSHAHVSHDVSIGDYSFIGPGVKLLGGATIGSEVLIGSNAVILPHIVIGDGVKVSANTVVRENVPPGKNILSKN